MSTQDPVPGRVEANDRDIDERLRSLTMRIHQTEEMITNMNQKVSNSPLKAQAIPGFSSQPAEASAMDVSAQEKI